MTVKSVPESVVIKDAGPSSLMVKNVLLIESQQ